MNFFPYFILVELTAIETFFKDCNLHKTEYS